MAGKARTRRKLGIQPGSGISVRQATAAREGDEGTEGPERRLQRMALPRLMSMKEAEALGPMPDIDWERAWPRHGR